MVKDLVKRVIGQERITFAKQQLKYIKGIKYLHGHKRIEVLKPDLLYRKYGIAGKNVFFGYYDLQQFDAAEERMLVHVAGEKADASKEKAQIGYFKTDTGDFVPVTETAAWCWQQGARLRWHPVKEDVILYNDVQDGAYVTREYDLAAGKETGMYCAALYDIDRDASFGLGVNFSRLQRLRPGYGYGTLPDETRGIPAPEEDGLFYVDLQTNLQVLLISLAELASEVEDPQADEHYINHVSIAPGGRRFLFFHIWTLKGDTHWRTRLCVYDFDTQERIVLEDTDRVSHYAWQGDDRILVTCWGPEKKQYYCVYDVLTGEKTRIEDEHLTQDGHPVFLSAEGWFLADTYPLAHDLQTLFAYDLGSGTYQPMARLYSDPRRYDETRCDLHPRVSPAERYITVDSTCECGLKQVVLFRAEEI